MSVTCDAARCNKPAIVCRNIDATGALIASVNLCREHMFTVSGWWAMSCSIYARQQLVGVFAHWCPSALPPGPYYGVVPVDETLPAFYACRCATALRLIRGELR